MSPAPVPGSPVDADAAKKAAIAAAMERARQQREAAQPKNTDAAALTAAQRHEIAEIDARRQPAPDATAPAADEK